MYFCEHSNWNSIAVLPKFITMFPSPTDYCPDYKILLLLFVFMTITGYAFSQQIIFDTTEFFNENTNFFKAEENDNSAAAYPIFLMSDSTHNHKISNKLFDNTRFVNRKLTESPTPDTIQNNFVPNDIIFIPADYLYNHKWDTQHVRVSRTAFSESDTTYLPIFTDEDSMYVFPNKNVLISPFGYRGRHFHAGVDIRCKLHDSIFCAFNGVVRMARRYGGYGNMVVVRHSNGIETLYGHLSKILVQPNQVIKAGEIIGLGGRTGHATATHLHFETRYLGEPFNPTQIFDLNDFSLSTDTLMITKKTFGKSKTKKNVQSYSRRSGSKYYKVRSGDTLSAIARKSGKTVKQLCDLNGIRANKTLNIGTRVRIR